MAKRLVFTIVLLVSLAVTVFSASAFAATPEEAAGYWNQYPSNPVIDPANPVDRAYYVSVLYDSSSFSGHGVSAPYRGWADYNSTTGTTIMYSSADGINWTENGPVSGLTNPRHCVFVYDAGGFGGTGNFFKIWYWDTAGGLASIGTMRTASSVDGITWTGDVPLGQDPLSPLVNGISGTYFYHCYGPADVFYNPAPTNNPSDPFTFRYTMYYDASPEGGGPVATYESLALAYSDDGVNWTRYGAEPVFLSDYDNPAAWDWHYSYPGRVIREGGNFHLFYSGGITDNNDAIGYAYSTNGINWTRLDDIPGVGVNAGGTLSNPLVALGNGVDSGSGDPGSWNEQRSYACAVLYDANKFDGNGNASLFKMWYSGRSATGNYAGGYANTSIPLPPPAPTPTTTPPPTVDPCDCAAHGYPTPCTYWLLPSCNQPAPSTPMPPPTTMTTTAAPTTTQTTPPPTTTTTATTTTSTQTTTTTLSTTTVTQNNTTLPPPTTPQGDTDTMTIIYIFGIILTLLLLALWTYSRYSS